MSKSLLLFVVALISSVGINAQSVLLERDINESVYMKKSGPNKNKFLHFYYDYSDYLLSKADPTYSLGSFRTYIGVRRYYRVANSYIMGFNTEFGWETFRIKQSDEKIFPAAELHKKEILSKSNLELEYFNRLLITQHENSLGIWIDGGIYGNLKLGSRHVTKDKSISTDEVRFHKVVNKGLKYVNNWEYGIKARIGYKRYAITGTYRLSDWISGKYSNFEPTRISAGFELGFY